MTTKANVGPHSRVWRSREMLFSQVDDDLLAVDAQSGYCYSLSQSAGRVWNLLDAPLTIDALCASLRAEHEVDEKTCLDQVCELVAQLHAAGLVEVDHARRA